MPKFTVHLQQYVEQIATVVVEADDEQEAKTLALDRAVDADWRDGDDAYKVEAYAIYDADGKAVWER